MAACCGAWGDSRMNKKCSVFWTEAYEAGHIAGAYWTLVSHTHVPLELRKRIFGEVHMLSQVLGRTTHAQAIQAGDLNGRVQALEAHLKRERDRHRAAIEERDRRLAYLSSRCQPAVSELQCPALSITAPAGRDRRPIAFLYAKSAPSQSYTKERA